MSDGFVVVCQEDGILFGAGKTKAAALEDAERWIEDAVRDQVSAEILHAKKGPSPRVIIDLTWTVNPATAALMASVGERGGHDDYRALADGTLDLGRKSASALEAGKVS